MWRTFDKDNYNIDYRYNWKIGRDKNSEEEAAILPKAGTFSFLMISWKFNSIFKLTHFLWKKQLCNFNLDLLITKIASFKKDQLKNLIETRHTKAKVFLVKTKGISYKISDSALLQNKNWPKMEGMNFSVPLKYLTCTSCLSRNDGRVL